MALWATTTTLTVRTARRAALRTFSTFSSARYPDMPPPHFPRGSAITTPRELARDFAFLLFSFLAAASQQAQGSSSEAQHIAVRHASRCSLVYAHNASPQLARRGSTTAWPQQKHVRRSPNEPTGQATSRGAGGGGPPMEFDEAAPDFSARSERRQHQRLDAHSTRQWNPATSRAPTAAANSG